MIDQKKLAEILGSEIVGSGPAQIISPMQSPFVMAKEVMVRIYNAGYSAGHHDTVEGGFVHVHNQDKATYHADVVLDLIEEFCRVANNGQ